MTHDEIGDNAPEPRAAETTNDSDGMPAHVPCNAPGTECSVESHDHYTTTDFEGIDHDTPFPMLCVDCRRPTHYDEADGNYHHDDPEAECWLIGPEAHFYEERRDNIREILDQLEKRRASQPEAEPPGQPGIEP